MIDDEVIDDEPIEIVASEITERGPELNVPEPGAAVKSASDAARSSAIAKLKKLGLTDAEARALVTD